MRNMTCCSLLRLYQILLLITMICIALFIYVLNYEHYLRDIPKKGYNYSENNFAIPPNNQIMDSDNISVALNLEEIEKLHRNIPFQFLFDKQKVKGQACQTLADLKDIIYKENNRTKLFGISINNQYWQEYESKRATFYLYSAYLDNRKYNEIGSTIRIIAMLDRDVKDNESNYCLIWYDVSNDPVISDVQLEMTPMGPKWKKNQNYLAYLLTCYVPGDQKGKIPKAVSVIEKSARKPSCNKPSNYLKVIHNNKDKKDFAVCVKGLNLIQDDNLSEKFVEWIEILSIMGVDKIFLYELALHSNIQKVLNYYARKGVVDLTKISLPGNQPNDKVQLNEYFKNNIPKKRVNLNIHLNDCLYRNIHRYKFIAIIDSDELIVPRELGHTWTDLVKTLSNRYNASDFFWFDSTYFFNDVSVTYSLTNGSVPQIPYSMHMLRHIYRSKNHRKGKSIIATENVKTVGMHRAFKCLDDHACKFKKVDEDLAHVAHYRDGCQRGVGTEKQCIEQFKKELVWDTTLWEFKNTLVPRCIKTLSQLGLKFN